MNRNIVDIRMATAGRILSNSFRTLARPIAERVLSSIEVLVALQLIRVFLITDHKAIQLGSGFPRLHRDWRSRCKSAPFSRAERGLVVGFSVFLVGQVGVFYV